MKSTFQDHGAFQAARPLYSVCRTRSTVQVSDMPELGFAELCGGPYYILSVMLDVNSLCSMDATCKLLRQLSRTNLGPWRELGRRAFHGLELEREGTFEPELLAEEDQCCRLKMSRVDWKVRYYHFKYSVPTFSSPFSGREVTSVAHPDEVAYLRCRLCTDVVSEGCSQGVYLEVEVVSNSDNLSMAVVDFEAGGCSSVTFSPDTGAVIRERKVREAPRKVEGAYIQPLPTVATGRPFHGLMGLYLYQDRLAFFRRCELPGAEASADFGRLTHGERGELAAWETTGFVSDLNWAEGRRLTPCLAFRDEGAYRVRIVQIGATPPIDVQRAMHSDSKASDWRTSWSDFDWEVGSSDALQLEAGAPTFSPVARLQRSFAEGTIAGQSARAEGQVQW
eukprot:CAMPEP_0181446104 /NCGR_PEP_ID=MMETSP1110-20121109/25934_1 /TAXON_ID=174948 /ORGANISM="Symbiodinium sp., Strain CCMP421" /LENGTH=392 /DNA_ID=CAMNT_0023570175 /DNA_START=20 /DNA_END=1196 /DNA_ORIENTATION=+